MKEQIFNKYLYDPTSAFDSQCNELLPLNFVKTFTGMVTES